MKRVLISATFAAATLAFSPSFAQAPQGGVQPAKPAAAQMSPARPLRSGPIAIVTRADAQKHERNVITIVARRK